MQKLSLICYNSFEVVFVSTSNFDDFMLILPYKSGQIGPGVVGQKVTLAMH